jgi:hypothetical protein
MKRLTVLVLAAIGLTLGACGGGGGGGDEEAFCSDLESLSDSVADGDLADDDGLEDALDTANDLAESAEEGDQLDAVNNVRDELEGADPADADDTAETIQDELGDFAEDCDIDEDDFAIAPTTTAPEETTTTAGGETTTTAGDGTTTTAGGGDGELVTVGPRQEVPAEVADQATATSCFNSDFAACDSLFAASPPDSPDEVYGDTCGGRIPEGTGLLCDNIFIDPSPPPADIVDVANGEACFNGDMAACDTLEQTDTDPDQQYGFFCGERLDTELVTTQTFCVDIFGETA